MPKLYLVGVTEDRTGLVLAKSPRAKTGDTVLEVDGDVLEAISEIRRYRAGGGVEPRVSSPALPSRRAGVEGESRLSPREIQRLLRQGQSISSVARRAGVDQWRVEIYASPIRAEQARIVQRARDLLLEKRGAGPSGRPLGESVLVNVVEKRVKMHAGEFEEAWSAYEPEPGRWVLRFEYVSRGRDQVAEWEYDPVEEEVSAANRLATILGWRDPRARGRLPQLPEAADEPPEPKRSRKKTSQNSGKSSGKSSSKSSGKKPAGKGNKPANKNPAGKKPAATKSASNKSASNKPVSKKPASKKPAAKKPAAKKPVSKKPASKKRAAKKPAGNQSTGRKRAGKKPAEKRPTGKKRPSRTPASRKTASSRRARAQASSRGRDEPTAEFRHLRIVEPEDAALDDAELDAELDDELDDVGSGAAEPDGPEPGDARGRRDEFAESAPRDDAWRTSLAPRRGTSWREELERRRAEDRARLDDHLDPPAWVQDDAGPSLSLDAVPVDPDRQRRRRSRGSR